MKIFKIKPFILTVLCVICLSFCACSMTMPEQDSSNSSSFAMTNVAPALKEESDQNRKSEEECPNERCPQKHRRTYGMHTFPMPYSMAFGGFGYSPFMHMGGCPNCGYGACGFNEQILAEFYDFLCEKYGFCEEEEEDILPEQTNTQKKKSNMQKDPASTTPRKGNRSVQEHSGSENNSSSQYGGAVRNMPKRNNKHFRKFTDTKQGNER